MREPVVTLKPAVAFVFGGREDPDAFGEETLPFAIRPYEPGDKHYILDSWLTGRLRELRRKYPERRMSIAARHAWFQECRPRFADALETSTVAIACDPEVPSRILGYLVGPPHNFSHVKAWCDPFRSLIEGALRAAVAAEED